MPKLISNSVLNASSLDILNVIRANASTEYQNQVPIAEKATDIPRVGAVIYGTPAFANQFINALVNRIAMVRVQSATFHNPYKHLKKGYIEFGESIESIFVGIAEAMVYNPEEGEKREFKVTAPDVRSVFHVMNWRVVYPVTIRDDDLRMAFTSADGVSNLIAKIVDAVYTAAEYDEFLLFKYLLIKAISGGKVKAVKCGDGTDLNKAAVEFRAHSNLFTFMSDKYNEEKVKTTTPTANQAIFMDSRFNAQFDVNVLAGAFNMEKADFIGRRHLIDDWTTFDNDRFNVIRAHSDGLEEVTPAELKLMESVKAVLVDVDWFQIYDNNNRFTEKYVASTLQWNYFYHTWKTISYSPFSNVVCFVTDDTDITLPASVTAHVDAKEESEVATVFTVSADFDSDGASLKPQNVQFLQTETLTAQGIAIQRFGGVIIPADKALTEITLEAELGGKIYRGATTISASTPVDATVTLNQV